MDCEILRTLYVKANGEIPCNDDLGEAILLGELENSRKWSISDIFQNQHFYHIRNSLNQGRSPWGDVCRECAFLKTATPLKDTLINQRIEKIQIEPSLLCDLDCPGCSRSKQFRNRKGPYLFPIELHHRLLSSLSSEGFIVEFFEFCGQGEPLKHPELSVLLRLTRRFFPNARIRLITNGNMDYRTVLKDQVPQELYVSCDGLHQSSYEKYRKNGSVKKAIQFMADAKRRGGHNDLVIWKYILFEFNDSDTELIEAQRRALELGIDEIQFILTHSKYKSKRFSANNLREIPIIPKIASIGLTPQLHRPEKTESEKSVFLDRHLNDLVIALSRQARKSGMLRILVNRNPHFRKWRRIIEQRIL